MLKYYLYILKSQKDNKQYVGITQDIDFRIKQHNWSKVKSTKTRRPLVLIHKEEFSTKKEALIREKYLKSYRGWKERLNF